MSHFDRDTMFSHPAQPGGLSYENQIALWPEHLETSLRMEARMVQLHVEGAEQGIYSDALYKLARFEQMDARLRKHHPDYDDIHLGRRVRRDLEAYVVEERAGHEGAVAYAQIAYDRRPVIATALAGLLLGGVAPVAAYARVTHRLPTDSEC